MPWRQCKSYSNTNRRDRQYDNLCMERRWCNHTDHGRPYIGHADSNRNTGIYFNGKQSGIRLQPSYDIHHDSNGRCGTYGNDKQRWSDMHRRHSKPEFKRNGRYRNDTVCMERLLDHGQQHLIISIGYTGRYGRL